MAIKAEDIGNQWNQAKTNLANAINDVDTYARTNSYVRFFVVDVIEGVVLSFNLGDDFNPTKDVLFADIQGLRHIPLNTETILQDRVGNVTYATGNFLLNEDGTVNFSYSTYHGEGPDTVKFVLMRMDKVTNIDLTV